MSEKRFVLEISSFSDKHMKFLNILDNGKRLKSEDIVDLLNEQQAMINNLQGDINRLNYIIEELRKDNYKKFKKIKELEYE